MRYKIGVLCFVCMFAACRRNKKAPVNALVSIHKVWDFARIDTSRSNFAHAGAFWIQKNTIDLTSSDSLRFSYKNDKGAPTAYPYHIAHDTLFVQNFASYRIIKLTANELGLAVIFNADSTGVTHSLVMVYKSDAAH